MTMHLLALRQAILMWTAMSLWPYEYVFDAIDAELERRGVVP